MKSLQEHTSLTIEPISIDVPPKVALEKFEEYSRRFIHPKKYVSGNFEWFWKAELKNGIAYIAKQRKLQSTAHMCYVYQFDTQSNPLWYAEIWGLIPVIQKVYEWFEEDGLVVRQEDWSFNFVKKKYRKY
jgi:hypothetical protein